MAHTKEHDYHILEPSVWPFLGAVGGFIMLLGAVLFFNDYGPWIMMIGMVLIAYVMIAWWGDVIKEAQTGDHTPTVRIGLRYGFILFVMSEIMFFAAWFWNFFKHALYPMEEGSGGVWPPVGIETFDPWHLPLINTLILLLSGAAATWAHHAIAHENNRKDLIQGLFWAIVLGIAFTGFQAYEYGHAAFSYSGNIYGATFFMATGFHGAHVIIGTAFLLVCLFRAMKGQFT
ncbi:MAG: cytochrome c oxidase subunit 3, partial [Rhodobacteraceae bacterium]|nr:cytochrome c oxidase subunit 3 [Paracoccaceae bacterium]